MDNFLRISTKSDHECYFTRLGLSGLMLPATISLVGNVNKEKSRFVKEEKQSKAHFTCSGGGDRASEN